MYQIITLNDNEEKNKKANKMLSDSTKYVHQCVFFTINNNNIVTHTRPHRIHKHYKSSYAKQ